MDSNPKTFPWSTGAGISCRQDKICINGIIRKVSSVSYCTSTLILDCIFLEVPLEKMATRNMQVWRVCFFAVLSVPSGLKKCTFPSLHLQTIPVTVNPGHLSFKYLSKAAALLRTCHHLEGATSTLICAALTLQNIFTVKVNDNFTCLLEIEN